VADVLALVLAQLLTAAGLGGLALRLAPFSREDGPPGWDLPRLCLAGLCVELTLLPLCNLAFPLGGAMRWAVGCLALAGLAWTALGRARPRLLPSGGRTRGAAWILACLALAAADAYAQTALGRPVLGDTGLYHLHSVRWAVEYPLVTGIANLHDRLGFNSAFFLHAALFDGAFFPGDSAWTAGAFFRLLAAAHLAFTALDGESPARARVFAAAALPYVVFRSLEAMASLGYDEAPQFLVLLAAAELLRSPADTLGGLRRGACLLPCWLALTACAVALTVKLSMAPALLFFGAPYLAAALGADRARRARLLGWGLLPALLAGGVYLGRNVLAGGWLFYPVPALRLDVPWAVDRADLVANTWNWILSWARAPGKTPGEVLGLGLEAWLPGWWAANRGNVGVRAVWWGLGVLAASAAAGRLAGGGGAPARAGGIRIETLCAFGLGALAVWWFLGAPDARFIDVLQAGFLAACLAHLSTSLGGRPWLLPAACCAAAALVFLAGETTFRTDRPLRWAVQDAFPRPAYKTVTVEARGKRFDVLAPLDTDMCWNAPLPCTPYPKRIRPERIRWPDALGRSEAP